MLRAMFSQNQLALLAARSSPRCNSAQPSPEVGNILIAFLPPLMFANWGFNTFWVFVGTNMLCLFCAMSLPETKVREPFWSVHGGNLYLWLWTSVETWESIGVSVRFLFGAPDAPSAKVSTGRDDVRHQIRQFSILKVKHHINLGCPSRSLPCAKIRRCSIETMEDSYGCGSIPPKLCSCPNPARFSAVLNGHVWRSMQMIQAPSPLSTPTSCNTIIQPSSYTRDLAFNLAAWCDHD